MGLFEQLRDNMFQSSLELSPECDRPRISPRRRTMPFQSSLELSPECDADTESSYTAASCFNPHSSSRPSATARPAGSEPGRAPRFNPHSSSRPSATLPTRLLAGLPQVSILTRALARVRPGLSGVPQSAGRVSILTRALARVRLLNQLRLDVMREVSILTRALARVRRPHPSVRAGRVSRGRLREPPQKGLRRRVGEGGGKTGFQCPLAAFSLCANPPGFCHLLGVRAKVRPATKKRMPPSRIPRLHSIIRRIR
jgi:hypothetical protein